jgi:thiamine-phosphate pyrophosphorylase
MKKMKLQRGLYAITPSGAVSTEALLGAVEEALEGGAIAVQYRDKINSPAVQRELAELLLSQCERWNVPLIINDNAELTASIGAQGVHIGRGDGNLALTRSIVGPDCIIGVSCYNRLDFALRAYNEGADYVAFGSFYSSSTKPEAAKADVKLLGAAASKIPLPIVAIGGISPQNGAPLVAAGASMLAAIDGLFGRQDIRRTALDYSALFNN